MTEHFGTWRRRLTIGVGLAICAGAASVPAVTHYYPGQLTIQDRAIFTALGSRLSTPGQERLILMGTLTEPAQSAAPLTVQVVQDITGSLNISGISGAVLSVVFNNLGGNSGSPVGTAGTPTGGSGTSGSGGIVGAPGGVITSAQSASAANQALIYSLSQDSVEQFIAGKVTGNAMRRIGYHAKMVDPQTPSAAPVVVDVYEVSPSSKNANQPQTRKVYCFDSATHLLSFVLYQLSGPSGTTNVETRYSNWKSVAGGTQVAPFKVDRFENTNAVLSLTVQSATLAAEAADNLFGIFN